MNKIILIGRLTNDIELKTSEKNGKTTSYAHFSVAVPRQGYGSKDANGNTISDFFNCSVFGNTAEMMAKYFSKGKAIEIDGSMHTSARTDESGKKTTYYNVEDITVHFPMPVPKKGEEGGSVPQSTPQPAPQPAPVSQPAPPPPIADDDIPF